MNSDDCLLERGKEFFLWSRTVPFAQADNAKKEHYLETHNHGIKCLTDVTNPSLTYFPVSGNSSHPAVMVCPGGGYSILAWFHEGIDICSYLNSIGFSAFLLKYRCPGRRQAAYADAARAMRFIRANAERFNLNKNKIGIIGFSAGAHLSATISAPAQSKPYDVIDEIDKLPFRPDYTALIYPAYLTDMDLNLAPEFKVDINTPPTFLLQAADDDIHVENSLAWYWTMKKVGAKAELHAYEEGGHGYGILQTGKPISHWTELATKWFQRQAEN